MKIYFSYNSCKVNDVECDERCTIREFLDSAEIILNLHFEDEDNYVQISLKNIHCVYLKCTKIVEIEKLQDYSDDLKRNILFIPDSTEKPFESSFSLINLNDYENFRFIERLPILQFIYRDIDEYCIAATDKKTKKEVFIKAYGSNPKNLGDVYTRMRGYSAISTLNHSGLVKILGFRYPLNEEEKKQTKIHTIQGGKSKKAIDLTGFIFVFDFVKYGSLLELNKNYLNSEGSTNEIINPTIRCKIIYGIASMMKYMHSESIIHRNLDIDNVLIDEKHEPKFSGFKLAKIVENDIYHTMAVGSPQYMAPETYMDGDEKYSFEVDVYAYGMILYQMFTNKIDFDNRKPVRYTQLFMMKIGRGLRPRRPENIPDSYWELIQKCWKQNPSDRPTFDEIVEELKNDKYTIEEFGMKTNIDELHEYQRRIDSSELNDKQCNSNDAQREIEELKSIILPPDYNSNSKNCFIDEEDEKFHQILSKIGEGATSIAYKIFDQRTEQIMCKKVLKIVSNSSSAFKALQNSVKEFEVLSRLKHPCICRAIGINTSEYVKDTNVNTNEETDVTTVALFLEFEDYSITDYLSNMNNTLKTKIAVEIAHAMNFIHKNGLIHRDLKIDNIRLNCIFEAKIIDFGLVRIHEILSDKYSFVQESMTKGVGTFAYMSPEMLNEEDYDYKTDVYSFGIVVYFLFVGSLPKQNLRDKLIGKEMEMPKPSQSISKCCIELISKCLSFKPSERPSFDEILKFISDNNFNLASFVDQQIVSRRNRELLFYEKSMK